MTNDPTRQPLSGAPANAYGYPPPAYSTPAPQPSYQQPYYPPPAQPAYSTGPAPMYTAQSAPAYNAQSVPPYAAQPGAYGQPDTFYGQPASYAEARLPEQPHFASQQQNLFVEQPGDVKFAPAPGYRDPLFAVGFLASIVITFIIAISTSGHSSSNAYFVPVAGDFGRLLLVCFLIAVAAEAVAGFWLWVIMRFPRQLIIISLVLAVLFWLAVAIFCFAAGQWIVGLIFMLIAGFHGLLYYWWRSRIEFAAAVLAPAGALVKAYPGTVGVAVGAGVVQFLWLLLWVWAISGTQTLGNAAGWVQLLLVFFLYWSGEVAKNVVHVTASGTFATWWFMSGTAAMPEKPTIPALKRTLTTSFGSVCFGSLLVALVQLAKFIVNRVLSRYQFLRCIVAWILGCIESILKYFNMYAFVQVAVYGKGYWQAAQDTMKLFASDGLQAIINDNLIRGVLLLGCFIGGVVCMLWGAILGMLIVPEWWTAALLFGFVIGFYLVSFAMACVQSGVVTLLVCFLMDPEALRRHSPELAATLDSTYRQWTAL